MPASSASSSATSTPEATSTTMMPKMVRVSAWRARIPRMRRVKASTHKMGRQARMPPKVTSLMVCPM